MATRYRKLEENVLSMIHLVLELIRLRDKVNINRVGRQSVPNTFTDSGHPAERLGLSEVIHGSLHLNTFQL